MPGRVTQKLLNLSSRLNWDPATASTPLITSLVDICGLLIYFYIATRLLGLAG